MLQASNIGKLLVQLLDPTPEVTSSLPISASLVSFETGQPLISCVSELYKKKVASKTRAKQLEEDEEIKSIESAINSSYDTTSIKPGNGSSESGPLTTGSTVKLSKNDSNEHARKTELLKKKIEYLDENFDSNYINANMDPSDNISILSILAVKKFKNRNTNDQWMIMDCSGYAAFLYQVDESYGVLLCCDGDYPKGFAIRKLGNLCKYFKSKF